MYKGTTTQVGVHSTHVPITCTIVPFNKSGDNSSFLRENDESRATLPHPEAGCYLKKTCRNSIQFNA